MSLRSHFDLKQNFIHLNNAGVTPLSVPCRDAMIAATQYTAEYGAHGYYEFLPRLESARKTVGDFINVEANQIAFVANCSTAISLFAFGLPLKAGDQIVISDQEYPSNRYPWHNRAKRDSLVINEIKSELDGTINWEKFISAIGPKTKVVAISWIQYSTGVRAPLKLISEKAKKSGAVVIVDVIQGLGVIPFDFQEEGVDAICGGSHKWLCGQLGHGFLAATPDLSAKVYPFMQGAMTFGNPDVPFDANRAPHASAARFESGGINMIGTLGLVASLDLFKNVGKAQIYKDAMTLRNHLIGRLKSKGLKIVAEVKDEEGSPIVTFLPKESVDKVAANLNAKKISFALRFGGIRISPHAFNTREEIETLCQIV